MHYGLLSSKTILHLVSFLYHIFNQKDGGHWETYCLYGVEGDGILSILWNFGFESIRSFPVYVLWSYFFVPLKDLEGCLCPEILILGIIYIVDTPFGISN